ncbi:MAG: ABC transporter ATP-binding protein [Flavobacteriales bacterium]|nr:ABC transporter ATP-binding protein [Flavobacteriales bacterium]MCB9168455.1 ABC transporter ATP-binding protein [Flavobacteriales bacterium]
MPHSDIRVCAVTKRYRGSATSALRGVDIDARRGEFLGLLGPNGAGKTTLLSIITGVLRPSTGTVEVRGAGMHADRRRALSAMGFVPQEIALYGTLTARENLAYFGRLQGLDRATLAARSAELLERTGLATRADEPVRQWSGGMQRRLNLITALLHDPAVLVLDEPTVGIDVQSRTAIWEELQAINARGTTVLYSSHHLEEAERLCSRVVIIDHGQVAGEIADMRTRSGQERLEETFLRITGRALRDDPA